MSNHILKFACQLNEINFIIFKLMQSKQKNATSLLKKISNNIENGRKNIEGDANLIENLATVKNSFGEIENVIKNQVVSLENMKNFSKEHSSESTKNLQVKRFFFGYCEKAKTQLKSLLEVVKQNFMISSKPKSIQNWQKVEKDLEKYMNSLKQQADTSQKMYSAINKINTAKDSFLFQFFRLMLYKKNILWRDLNAPYDDYIHGDIKSVINLIKSNEEKLGYIPNTLEFNLPKFQIENTDNSLTDLLRIILVDHGQLIQGLKNYSKLSDQPQVIEDISKNQHIVKGLRQRIEVLTQNHQSLLEKYRALQISKGKVTTGPNQEKSMTEKMEEMETLLIKKEQEIIQLKQASLKQDSFMMTLKDKNKELEDELSKWLKNQGPKLKEMEGNQKSLLQEFNKVRRDLETYSNMLQNQREEKIKTLEDLKAEKSRVLDLANILGRQRRKIKELKQQITRQEKIVMELLDRIPDK